MLCIRKVSSGFSPPLSSLQLGQVKKFLCTVRSNGLWSNWKASQASLTVIPCVHLWFCPLTMEKGCGMAWEELAATMDMATKERRMGSSESVSFCYDNLYCGEGNGTPLQYSCLENPMDGGAWWAAVHGVARCQTQVSNFTIPFHFDALEKKMATYSSVLAWRIPGTGEPGGLPSVGRTESETTEAT